MRVPGLFVDGGNEHVRVAAARKQAFDGVEKDRRAALQFIHARARHHGDDGQAVVGNAEAQACAGRIGLHRDDARKRVSDEGGGHARLR